MAEIKLLDCTLRDGGYINDWDFGEKSIYEIGRLSSEAGSDIVELGFLRDVPYQKNIAVFQDIKQINPFMTDRSGKTQYAVMCEAMHPLPVEKIAPRKEEDVDIIRVIVWKRLLKEGFEYCKGIVERGYKLCVQPNRVDQYSDEEFRYMVERFNELDPYALYIVDSFGVLDADELLHYAELADIGLKQGIALGYHGHNNLMQAYGTAQGFIQKGYKRELFLDASVYGIGRGAGNLNIELIAKYLNERKKGQYHLEHYVDICENYIKSIYEKEQWGYSMAYYLTALYRCNPMYGQYYSVEKQLDPSGIRAALQMLIGEEKIRFSAKTADAAYEKYLQSANE